jgi:hypothetical protein
MSEQTLILGAENHLIATLTPAEGSASGPPPYIAVLTNSGVIPRSGPHRMNVHLARRFARIGIPSIRFDMSGLGDSHRSSGTLPVLQQWVADTRSVMDTAQGRFACNRFFMVGFCSGAEVAHLVALEDDRLRGAVLWDLYAYPTFQSRLRTLAYRLRRAGPAGVVKKVVARLKSITQGGAEKTAGEARAVEVSLVPPMPEYAQRLNTLVDKEVALLVAFCGGEPEWFNHAGQFRAMLGSAAFVDKIAFRYLESSDHLITRREAQLNFTDMVVDWLQERLLSAPR